MDTLEERYLLSRPDAVAGPPAPPSPMAVTDRAPPSGSDAVGGRPVSPASLAWTHHALPGGFDAVAGRSPPPAFSAWTHHALPGSSDAVAWSPAFPALLAESDRATVYNNDGDRPNLMRPLARRVESSQADHNEFMSASHLDSKAAPHGGEVVILARDGRDDDERPGRVPDEPATQARAALPVRAAFPFRHFHDDRGAGPAPSDDPPVSPLEPKREPATASSPASLTSNDPKTEVQLVASSESSVEGQEEMPPPEGAGLIADVLPFDRAPLEAAIDRFFESIEDLGAGPLGWQGVPTPIPPALALAIAATAMEVAWRQLRRTSGDTEAALERCPDAQMGLSSLPRLPGPWSMRPS